MTFLREALAARSERRDEACAIWLSAANVLRDLDDDSILQMCESWLRRDRGEDAAALADVFAQLYPDRAGAQFCLGYVLQRVGRHAFAIDAYERATVLDPNYPSLRNNFAAALKLTGGDKDKVCELLEQAQQVDPDDVNAVINLTCVYSERMDIARALEAGAKAVELAPHNALALGNYSLALKEAKRWDEAEHMALRAYHVAPQDLAGAFNLSILHLVRGNFADGLREYEARWDGSAELRGKRPAFPKAPWRGESLRDKTLLVWGEQGFGDVFQFCRYIPLIANRVREQGGRIAWTVFPTLAPLLARSLGGYVDTFTTGGIESLSAFDCEVGLQSLPLFLGTRANTIPASIPYLLPDLEKANACRTCLANERRLKVGLAWTGSRKHPRNPFRSIPIERLAQVFASLNQQVAFYSLQKGESAAVERARLMGLDVVDSTLSWSSFDDTAAFIESLDLVITVCTSVAHLSGALGKPTWVLLDTNPHWVWQLERSDSPWYPDVRLYRQPEFAQWAPVLDEVRADLTMYAGQQQGGLASERGMQPLPRFAFDRTM
ncbi:tetratricopeptide repeat-containing glycosyltransferase family protein [Trinickia acidisoli]|uniref:tetratricopeptide repeat-containing glycosyltransferase family protein n=1 Tax=Trinickia acidisoli TaxID=2767482 RepID=UPI001A8F6873|nr:tetratricopeptide repeat-containing glycosyltransferase family protein [Trinickia acidisoli]